MALTNPSITKAWLKYVESGTEFTFTAPFNGTTVFEVAPMATDAAPSDTLRGVPIIPGSRDGASRANVGAGYVFIRVAPEQTASSAPGVLLTWS